MTPHPVQPLVRNADGIVRFKPNAIVRFLVDWASSRGMSLNDLGLLPFTNEDRAQLAQLIGYSLSGYGGLPYVTDEEYALAEALPVSEP